MTTPENRVGTAMAAKAQERMSRNDWIGAAIRELDERGVDGIKVVVLARKLGVTSGSFYWHFKDLPELLGALLDHWEMDLTDRIIERSRAHDGPPQDRIFQLMTQVIENNAAGLDHAISVWAGRDPEIRRTFERTIRKRLQHAAWMFRQTGFGERQAAIRGRLMVAYLMGESSTLLKSDPRWRAIIRQEFEVLVQPEILSAGDGQ